MQTSWLNREHNPDCILFMAGWGMGPEPFQAINCGTVDLLMVYDYRRLDDCDLVSQLSDSNSRRIHLLAWSMGVWVSGRLLGNVSFSSATAIGGTCRPVDDKYGIPGRVFDETIHDFSPAVLTNFYSSMFDRPEHSDRFLGHLPNRSQEELKEEMIALRAACLIKPEVQDIFGRRIVTTRDRIFPARNQIRAWGREKSESIVSPHFPFYQWSSWAELLGLDEK